MKLDLIRSRIDEIDDTIADLLSERLGLSGDIAAIKAEMNMPIKDPGREENVLKRVMSKARTEQEAAAIRQIYEQVISASRVLQAGDRVGVAPERGLTPLYFPQVAIVGLGLIGAALARQIRTHLPDTKIIGIDTEAVLEQALAMNVIDKGASDCKDAIKGSSLIILCAPPRANIQVLEEIAPRLRKGKLVLDVTSTKSAITKVAEGLNLGGADFVGGHPLFGSEKSGIENAAALSIDTTVFCLVLNKKSSEMAVRRLVKWLSSLNLTAEILDAQEHDAALARTSHLIQILSITLGAQLAEGRDKEQLMRLLKLSGPSLKQLSRLMKSPVQLWTEIIEQNRDEILPALKEFEEKLDWMKSALHKNDRESLNALFAQAQRVPESF